MTNIIENQELSEQYKWFIDSIPNDFYVTGECKLPQIFIVEHNECLQFPLSLSTISRIKEISSPSPFGLGAKTVHDINYRNSFELDTLQFNVNQFSFSSINNIYLEKIRKSLLPDIDHIICEPYKLLIYESGSFFKPHVDTPRSQNHFGTLIMSLPCSKEYFGGELLLSFDNKQIKWEPNNTTLKCEYIAFYSDIKHEIKEIMSNNRIVITFNLSIPDYIKDKQFEKAMMDQNKSKWNKPYGYISDYFYSMPPNNNYNIQGLNKSKKKLFDALSNCVLCKTINLPKDIIWVIVEYITDCRVLTSIQNILNNKIFHENNKYNTDYDIYDNGILIIFDHKYHGKHINPLSLKGRDMYLYKTFKKYFGVFLTSITVASVIGKWSDDMDPDAQDPDNYGGIIDEWDEKDDKTKWKIDLIFLPKILETKIRPHYSKFIVLYNNKEKTLIDGKYFNEGEEYYGNCGTYDITNQYRVTGILLTKYYHEMKHLGTDSDVSVNYKRDKYDYKKIIIIAAFVIAVFAVMFPFVMRFLSK